VQDVVRHLLDEGLLGAARLQQEQGSTVQQYAAGGSSSSSSSSSSGWGLMYSWHGKRYLGAAHGEDGWEAAAHTVYKLAAGVHGSAARPSIDAYDREPAAWCCYNVQHG
jgi:hypothetical protein